MPDQQTEKATPQHRKKAREQGQIVRSRELTASLVLLGGVLFLGWFANAFVVQWRTALRDCVRLGVTEDLGAETTRSMLHLADALLLPALLPVGLLFGSSFWIAALVSVAQSGGMAVNQSALTPQFARLGPQRAAKQIFSVTNAVRMLKSLVPTVLVGLLAFRLIEGQLSAMPVMGLGRFPKMFHGAHTLLLQGACIMIGWSALDYFAEWRAHESRLRMSKEEIRQEMKESEGSPQVRRRIRSLQRQMRRRKIKADVSRASVVITNPTHYAVALEFSLETMQAPKVLAKGRNIFAEQIKQEARDAAVPIVENPPLARSLYRSVEVGQYIPQDLYTVVAEILAFLYRAELERQARARAEQQSSAYGYGHAWASSAEHETPASHRESEDEVPPGPTGAQP